MVRRFPDGFVPLWHAKSLSRQSRYDDRRNQYHLCTSNRFQVLHTILSLGAEKICGKVNPDGWTLSESYQIWIISDARNWSRSWKFCKNCIRGVFLQAFVYFEIL